MNKQTSHIPLSKGSLSFALLHFTVFLWGFTAILGKLISYSSFMLVWHRMTITFIVYCLIPEARKQCSMLSTRQIAIFCLIGMLVCCHWLAFYSSIKLGDSASITLACMGSVSLFSSICEPLILGIPFSAKDLLFGIFAMNGVLLICTSLPRAPPSPDIHYEWAVVTGIGAAFVGSVFTILNKKYIHEVPPLAISTVEMGSGALCLTLIVPLMYGADTKWYPTINIHDMTIDTMRSGSWDLIWVLILAVLCTNLTFYLSTFTLQHLSAFTINLTCNLEPIYGIVLGAVCFKENKNLTAEFYLGTVVILLAVMLNPVVSSWQCCSSSVHEPRTKKGGVAVDEDGSNGSMDILDDCEGGIGQSSVMMTAISTHVQAEAMEENSPLLGGTEQDNTSGGGGVVGWIRNSGELSQSDYRLQQDVTIDTSAETVVDMYGGNSSSSQSSSVSCA
jgi:drug/metabolite transporter (DMT)-like permease